MEGVVRHSAVPPFYRREHIHSGYRVPGLSTWDAARSFFQLHNETVNVWTHGLGLLYFVLASPPALGTVLSSGGAMDVTVFVVFILSAQICLGARCVVAVSTRCVPGEWRYPWAGVCLVPLSLCPFLPAWARPCAPLPKYWCIILLWEALPRMEMGAVLRRLTPPRPASPRVCW
jgi:hypothetical protein